MTTMLCRPARAKRRRTTLSITIDPHILEALKLKMEEWDETNLSATIEGLIDCGIRDTCAGCPYEESTGQQRVGVGKVTDGEVEK